MLFSFRKTFERRGLIRLLRALLKRNHLISKRFLSKSKKLLVETQYFLLILLFLLHVRQFSSHFLRVFLKLARFKPLCSIYSDLIDNSSISAASNAYTAYPTTLLQFYNCLLSNYKFFHSVFLRFFQTFLLNFFFAGKL